MRPARGLWATGRVLFSPRQPDVVEGKLGEKPARSRHCDAVSRLRPRDGPHGPSKNATAARLVGSVTSSPAAPIVNATVVLDGPTGPVATTRTTATGTFALEAPEGEFTLRVVAAGFDTPPRRVTLRG